MYEAFCEGDIGAGERSQLKIGEAEVVEGGCDTIEVVQCAFER